jgi:hypothetical protein
MALIRLYMTMSLDGYVTGPQDSPDTPMGIGGFRLFNWLELDPVRRLTTPQVEELTQHVTHLRYRIRRPGVRLAVPPANERSDTN